MCHVNLTWEILYNIGNYKSIALFHIYSCHKNNFEIKTWQCSPQRCPTLSTGKPLRAKANEKRQQLRPSTHNHKRLRRNDCVEDTRGVASEYNESQANTNTLYTMRQDVNAGERHSSARTKGFETKHGAHIFSADSWTSSDVSSWKSNPSVLTVL